MNRNIIRTIRFFLISAGILMFCAIIGVFLTREWIIRCNNYIGLAKFPDVSLVYYLIRVVSALYVILGILLLIFATDIERYSLAIKAISISGILGGILLTYLLLKLEFPLWWSISEGPLTALWGLIVFILMIIYSRQDSNLRPSD